MSDPKDETFRNITCESLTVQNDKGGYISLSFTEDNRPQIKMSATETNTPVLITTDNNGGVIAISGEDNLLRIHLRIWEDGLGYLAAGSANKRILFPPPDTI